jgi:hypothetical protein
MATTTAGAATAPTSKTSTQAPMTPDGISLGAVEEAVMELLRSDRRALKLAADLPLIFRVPVTVNGTSARFGGRFETRRFPALAVKGRWGSRWLTRLYVETHVRRQLEALRASLRLERLGTALAEDRARIDRIEDELGGRVPPLLGWRRLLALLARLPALAAAVPIVWAASILPVGDFSFGSVGSALLALGLTALAVWVLVVWPAMKLGFRVKRAIFAGGADLAHPFWDKPGEAQWSTLTESAPSVYAAEDAAFRALGRRKPAELPLDLLLSFVPYVSFAVLGLFVVGLVDAVRSGFEGYTWDSLYGVWVVPLIVALPFAFVRNAVRNGRARPH